ncbi:MAG TPA: diacylglycerol kinase family protein [Pyrinomonadaceae bacterium]|jgi:YegS/Rv2252/BmrU family lipid kinase|nr:diacylglycerol kinase family protein [Pyrinomonadaceae bacterium]
MRPLIIINHAAAKAQRAWPLVRARLDAAGLDFDFHETTQPGDASVRTRAALKTGVNTIAVIGGDGTLSEAAQGFFEFSERLEDVPSPINTAAVLAILPAGTGDDFARSQKGRREPLEGWIDTFITYCKTPAGDQVRLIDVLYGLCNEYQSPFICLNASTMGIGGETAARVAAHGGFMRRFSGEVRFAMAALAALAGWRERRVRVSVDDGEIIDGNMNLVAVANALYAGGGMMFAPEAKLSDGKLDVVTACGLNRLEIVRELARIHKGGHVANPKVRIVQGEGVSIETFSAEDAMPIEVDGNVRGVTPVEFRVLPSALRFVVGTR